MATDRSLLKNLINECERIKRQGLVETIGLTNFFPKGPDSDNEIRRLGEPKKEFMMSELSLRVLPKDWSRHAGGAEISKVKKKFPFPKNVALKVSKPKPENKNKPDFRRKEQKQIKAMLGVLSHGASGLGPQFLMGFDLNAAVNPENCQAVVIRTVMEMLIERFSVLEQEIFKKEVLEITNVAVDVDVENGLRNFGDAEETAKSIMKREKLKKAGNARKAYMDNPRTDRSSKSFKGGFSGGNHPNGKPTGQQGPGYMGKNFDPNFKRGGSHRGGRQGTNPRSGGSNNAGNGGQ